MTTLSAWAATVQDTTALTLTAPAVTIIAGLRNGLRLAAARPDVDLDKIEASALATAYLAGYLACQRGLPVVEP